MDAVLSTIKSVRNSVTGEQFTNVSEWPFILNNAHQPIGVTFDNGCWAIVLSGTILSADLLPEEQISFNNYLELRRDLTLARKTVRILESRLKGMKSTKTTPVVDISKFKKGKVKLRFGEIRVVKSVVQLGYDHYHEVKFENGNAFNYTKDGFYLNKSEPHDFDIVEIIE